MKGIPDVGPSVASGFGAVCHGARSVMARSFARLRREFAKKVPSLWVVARFLVCFVTFAGVCARQRWKLLRF